MEWILNIVATVAIPFIVQFLKKIKLPSKFAPIVAFVLAVIYVVIAKMAGVDADLNTIWQSLIQALAIAGVGVLGYDTVKKLSGK